MAKVLVLAFDTFGGDDVSDRMAWKLGHIIDVKPDDHVWGNLETLPKFWRINLPTVTVAQVNKFLDSKIDYTNPTQPVQVGIRAWKLDPNSMTPSILNELMTIGEITVTQLNKFNGYMKLV